MKNMQQNHRNQAKLLDEFQFHTQLKIHWKQISHKSATKIFGRPNIHRKIPLASRMAVKKLAGGLIYSAAFSSTTQLVFWLACLLCLRI